MLVFSLKKEWFDKIKPGEKTIEYCEVKEEQIMKILDYYDDEKIKENAVFFTYQKTSAAFFLDLYFVVLFAYKVSALKVVNGEAENPSAAISCVFLLLLVLSILFLLAMYYCVNYFNGNELPSKKALIALKEKYERNRELLIEICKYKYSVFTLDWDGKIEKEILCNSFTVDINGHAFIKNELSGNILDESEFTVKYHHIFSHREGSTLSAGELKNLFLAKIEEKMQ